MYIDKEIGIIIIDYPMRLTDRNLTEDNAVRCEEFDGYISKLREKFGTVFVCNDKILNL